MSRPPADLILIAGPIGNLGDITPRAREALEASSFVIAEDSRVTGRLLQLLEIKKPLAILNDHTSPAKIDALVARISEEGQACLLTDAGTPGISDPGALLVEACAEAGLDVDALPGASAVTTALSLSGFFAQRFAFLGFLPKKPGPVAEVLKPFVDSSSTLVLFESPFRVLKTLEFCEAALGDRRVAICRELTKMHQQVWRTSLSKRPTEKDVPLKGEFTIVIEGKRRANQSPEE